MLALGLTVLLSLSIAAWLAWRVGRALTPPAPAAMPPQPDAAADLAARVEVENEVERAGASLVTKISHEFRTPLTAVIGLSNAMLEGYTGALTPQQRYFLQLIQEKGEQLNLLVSNLLDLQRLEAGRLEPRIEAAALEPLVQRALARVEPAAKQKGLVLVNRFDLKSAPVLMDRVQAQSVMLNLIDNAVKFTPAGGKIEIDGRLVEDQAEPRYVELIVSDTGIGIAAPEQRRLFRRFARVESSDAAQAPGAGLGLAVALQLATRQGGWLTLKQRPGWSTTFAFGLPLAAAGRPFDRSTEQPQPMSRGTGG